MSASSQMASPYDPFTIASGGYTSVQDDWMPASACRSLAGGDPCVLWLEWYGDKHGFTPSTSPYSFNDFLIEKGKELEAAWLSVYAKNSVRVCHHDGDARLADKLRVTLEMMNDGAPVIIHPALWWAPEKIYGVPDLIALSTWLEKSFPNLLPPAEVNAGITGKSQGHYIALDIKVKTKIDQPSSKDDLEIVQAQLGLYSYMLGQMQGFMPHSMFVVCRDRVASPFRLEVKSALNAPLDGELTLLRDQWRDLRINGSKYLPWKDDAVGLNLGMDNERWDGAKKLIAKDRIPGGCPTQLRNVTHSHKEVLAAAGFASLKSLIDADPATIPFDQCKRIGKGKTATLLKAILQAQRTGKPVLPPKALVPLPNKYEYFVDYEFFQNVNFDCKKQWPTLQGCSMVFMAGVGFEENGEFKCVQFIAETESQDEELKLFTELISFLDQQTGGACCDATQTALYHWTPAEVTQSNAAADSHQLPPDHSLRNLNWVDLNKVFVDGPVGVPGCLDTNLKHVAQALGSLDARYDPAWPKELATGLGAMVMGWKSYTQPNPMDCMEMKCLKEYLAADCRALWQILRWLRS